jgi:hypothetical protein
MDLVDEFRKHADECREAARASKDATGRAEWQQLAGRWERCLEAAKAATAAEKNVHVSRRNSANALPKRSVH